MESTFTHHSNPQYGAYIHASRYGRFNADLGRRETYLETVDRYAGYLCSHLMNRYGDLNEQVWEALARAYESLSNQHVMGSMRAMSTAGPALTRDNTAGYNCAYAPIRDIWAFGEALHVLMCGAGIGYSVEWSDVRRLPRVPDNLGYGPTIQVQDSKEGWKNALDAWMECVFYGGDLPTLDVSQVRPRGTPLKTFGGTASGPEPLVEAIEAIKHIIIARQGQKLRPIDVHDMMCHIAHMVVSGGVRRAAMISLSDFNDTEMQYAKSGEWWKDNPQRALANNSYVIDSTKPETTVSYKEFREEWNRMVASMSGERGFFNRDAARKKAARLGRDPDEEYGCNPCSEIILKPYEFCNLTEVVVRPEDTLRDFISKCGDAAALGVAQSTLDNFPQLRREWHKNAQEERLLGVSITGIMDHPVLSGYRGYGKLIDWLNLGNRCVREFSRDLAKDLGINPPSARTCVKPSGTVSQLVDSASGIHPRYSRYYIRNVRDSKDSPVAQFAVDNGIPYEEDRMMSDRNWVFSFPMSAQHTTYTADEFKAIDQLSLAVLYERHWADHKVSMTAYYDDEDTKNRPEIVREFVWQHIDNLFGIAFLPYFGGIFDQAPYIPISHEEYHKRIMEMPEDINWFDLARYESEDHTHQNHEFACSGGSCDVL